MRDAVALLYDHAWVTTGWLAMACLAFARGRDVSVVVVVKRPAPPTSTS